MIPLYMIELRKLLDRYSREILRFLPEADDYSSASHFRTNQTDLVDKSGIHKQYENMRNSYEKKKGIGRKKKKLID